MQFTQVKTRIAVMVLCGVLGLQLVTLLLMHYTASQHARSIAKAQIEAGERVFVHVMQQHTHILKQSALLLATDVDFREAIAGKDETLMRIALLNYQSQLHAQFIHYFTQNQRHIQVNQTRDVPELTPSTAQLAAQRAQSGALQFEILEGEPYQLIYLPVQGADATGWLILGFKLNHPLLAQIKQLSSLDVSLVQKRTGQSWQVVASTLSTLGKNGFADSAKQLDSQINRTASPLQELQLGNEDYYLKTNLLQAKNGESLAVVLQSPVRQFSYDTETEIATMLLITMVGLAVFFLLSWRLSATTKQPLTALLDSTNEIAAGNVQHRIDMQRSDEFGLLGQALNRLTEALTAREQQIAALVSTDPLTGLRNRRALLQSLKQGMHSHSLSKQTLAVLVFNIESFKQINTVFGRALADALLVEIGQQIGKQVYSARDLVARLEADSFAVVLTQSTHGGATQFVERIRQLFVTPLQIDGYALDVRMRVGISIFPDHGQDEEQLLQRAQIALEHCKKKKSTHIVYNATLEIDPADSVNMQAALQRALEKEEFLLYIQPIVDIHQRKVIGGEALIRWVHPDMGMLLPAQFIPFAEQNGLISSITQWMLIKTCAALAAFQKQGTRFAMAVNLSARDLNNENLPEYIASLLKNYGLNAAALKLEVTEETLRQDPERSRKVLDKLSALGVQVAIDDFGIGYSSMSSLRQLPVHALKIDISFVMFMDKTSSDLAIVKSTIDLAHNLGLKVVAEGIESEEVYQQLDALGCNEGQGYFIGKPMPVRDFALWMERWQGQYAVTLDLDVTQNMSNSVATSALTATDVELSHLDFNLSL